MPVYLAGDWQDEQTGGYFANLLDQFTGTKEAWFTAQNGSHADPFDPTVFARWVQFLSIFVAQKVPHQTALTSVVASTVAQHGVRDDRAAAARSVRERDDVRAGEADLRAVPARAHPVRERRRRRPGRARAALRGRLPVVAGARITRDAVVLRRRTARSSTPRRARRGADSYVYDPSHQHDTTIADASTSATVGRSCPTFIWNAPTAGTALAYETAPLDHDVTVIGNSSVDLWLKSTAPDTDIQVTITEVRPDGQEVYVQNGWLRASDRALASDATELRPTHPLTQGRGADAARAASSRSRASRCSRSRTCSAPARASA